MKSLEERDRALIEAAGAAIRRNYDGENFHHTVGAAVRCGSGAVYTGVNVYSIHGACAVNGVHIHAGINCAAAAPHGRAYGVMEVFAVIVPANRRTGGLNQGAVSLFQRLHCPAPLSGLGNKKALPPN